MDYLTPAKNVGANEQMKKKKTAITCGFVDFAVLVNQRVKLKESGKKRQIVESCSRPKKSVEDEGQSNTNRCWCTRNGLQQVGKGVGEIGNQ